jgi:hypothetical protein
MAKGALVADGLFADQERIGADMAHLGAVVLMFDPNADLSAIQPIRPYRANRGNWARSALDCIRTAERPITTIELARAVMVKERVPLDDRTALNSIICSLHAVLRKRVEDGSIRAYGRPKRWSAARD